MSDRGPNQDQMNIAGTREKYGDATYRDASYLGTDERDEEEVHDLGFIVDDHDDRRATLTDGWERLDDLDTDEALETNRSGPIPHAESRRARGVNPERFATDYHVNNADAEEEEEDFVETSMLSEDPEMNDGADDFTSESLPDQDGDPLAIDIAGHVPGVGYGMGTTVPQDLGRGGFQIEDNPLMRSVNRPISDEHVSDVALGIRDVDEMGSDEELDRLADRAALDMERNGDGEGR